MASVRLGAVLPLNHLEVLQKELDYAFVEPISDFRYIDFYKNFSGEKILDNAHGQYGINPLDLKSLNNYTRTVDATYVIAPDKLGDWSFNQKMALEFSYHFWSSDKILVCLAGPHLQYFQAQASWVRSAGFGGICLPYKINRIPLPFQKVHLLGLRVPEQFGPYIHGMNSQGISLDTSEPISAAMLGIDYAQQGGLWTVKRPKEYMHVKMDETQLACAISNIHFLKRWLEERSQREPV